MFASGLARHGPPPGARQATLIARPEPVPALGILADLDPSGLSWLSAMRGFLDRLPSRLRSLEYSDVESLVEELASVLRVKVGEDVLNEARFVGIPRGGLIVLGMLAYVLGLDPTQLSTRSPGSGPVVVVDDCAYSGTGLNAFLEGCAADDVVFACLLAPPSLLESLAQTEPRVSACVSAGELADLTPTGDEGAAWRSEWAQRLERPRYWLGITEYVCFPWGEPDWSYWDHHSQRVVDGWSVMPPEISLKHRHPAPNEPLPVQIQRAGRGPLTPGPAVLAATWEGEVRLVNMDTDSHYGLDGVAADMWREVLAHGDVAAASAAIAAEYDADPEEIHGDLTALVGDLLAAGLLHRSDGG